MAVVSGRAGTVRVLGGGAGGVIGEMDGEAGTGGHWTVARERHMVLANVALNMPVASGKQGKGRQIEKLSVKCTFSHDGDRNVPRLATRWQQIQWKINKPLNSSALLLFYPFFF